MMRILILALVATALSGCVVAVRPVHVRPPVVVY